MAFTLPRIAALTAFIASFIVSPVVLAHAHLQGQSPAADAIVTAVPQNLTLDFSEGIEPAFSGVTLTGPQQSVVKTGKVKRSADNEKQLVVPLEETLKAGDYVVSWHVVSVDGHKTKGTYHFSVK